MKKVSIIIPVYNVALYLQKCVDSLLAQTYDNIELILVEDGSTDGSDVLCDTLEKTDARIHVYHGENKGVSAARNTGIAKAEGDYICFCDADDFVEKDMYEYLVSLLEKNEADMAMCGGWVDYGMNRCTPFMVPPKQLCLDAKESIIQLHKKTFFSAYIWNKIFCRDLLEQESFQEELCFAEDYDILCRVLPHCKKVICGTEPKYHYVQRDTSICKESYGERFRRAEKMFGRYKEYWQKCFAAEYEVFEAHYMYEIIGLMAVISRSKDYTCQDWKRMQKYVRKHIWSYWRNKEAGIVLKISALFICVNGHLFGLAYRIKNYL